MAADVRQSPQLRCCGYAQCLPAVVANRPAASIQFQWRAPTKRFATLPHCSVEELLQLTGLASSHLKIFKHDNFATLFPLQR